MNLRQVGANAEDAACAYLIEHGYEILDRNVYVGKGELDIVAKHADVTVFVEVKYRASTRYGTPAEAVTAIKKRRILHAALCYAAQHDLLDQKIRFDILELTKGKIRHIEEAFDATDVTV